MESARKRPARKRNYIKIAKPTKKDLSKKKIEPSHAEAALLVDYFRTTLEQVVYTEKLGYLKSKSKEMCLDFHKSVEFKAKHEKLDTLRTDNVKDNTVEYNTILKELCDDLQNSIENKIGIKLSFKTKFNHLGTLLDDRSSDVTLFYAGLPIHPMVAPIFYDEKKLLDFEFHYTLFKPTLTLENISYFDTELVDYYFNPMLKQDVWKKFFEEQKQIIKNQLGSDEKAEFYMSQLIKKIAGAYIYALANASATKAEKIESFIDINGDIDLYCVSDFPNDIKRYSYLFIKNNLYYVSIHGRLKSLTIDNPEKFQKKFNKLKIGSNGQIHLNKEDVYNLITLHTQHVPEKSVNVMNANMSKQNALSRIAHNYHLPPEEIIQGVTDLLKSNIKNKFANFEKIILPKHSNDLKDKDQIQNNLSNFSKGLISIRQDKQYLCSVKADQIFLEELYSLFEKVKKLSGHKYLKKKIAEAMGDALFSIEIKDLETSNHAILLFKNIWPFFGEKAKDKYKSCVGPLVSSYEKFEKGRTTKSEPMQRSSTLQNLSVSNAKNQNNKADRLQSRKSSADLTIPAKKVVPSEPQLAGNKSSLFSTKTEKEKLQVEQGIGINRKPRGPMFSSD